MEVVAPALYDCLPNFFILMFKTSEHFLPLQDQNITLKRGNQTLAQNTQNKEQQSLKKWKTTQFRQTNSHHIWPSLSLPLMSLVIIALGIWLATRPGDCERSLLAPVFIVGAFFLVVAVLGLWGSWFAIVPVLYAYLFLMFLVLLTFLIVTIFIFVVTAPGRGYTVDGQIFKEYRLSAYSKYVQDKLGKQSNWNHVKACIAGTNNCASFNKISPNAYLSTSLNPIQSGCCRPPSKCGYPMTSPGTFDTYSSSNTSSTTNFDCQKYSNNVTVKCYECDSCKGGVAQELKQTGRVAGIVTLVIFLILVLVYAVACCASHNAAWEHYGRV